MKVPAATKLANKIQHAAITAANPMTNPTNSQLLAPLAPKQPPLYASPLICAFVTEFTLQEYFFSNHYHVISGQKILVKVQSI